MSKFILNTGTDIYRFQVPNKEQSKNWIDQLNSWREWCLFHGY